MARGDNNGNRGRGGFRGGSPSRGGRGGRGGNDRGNGRGGRGGRGRGGRGRGGFDPYLDGPDFVLQQWNEPPYAAQTPRGRGRGSYIPRGNGTPRGTQTPQGPSTPRGSYTPRGRARGSGIGSPDAPRGRPHERGYAQRLGVKLGAGAPLSRILYEDRPFLRPVIFVRGVHTAILFQEEEEILQAIVEDVADEEEAHVPTADRVARLFGVVEDSASSDEANEGEESLEEIDFADMGRMREEVEALAANRAVESTLIKTTATTVQAGVEHASVQIEEKATSFFIDTTPSIVHDTPPAIVDAQMAGISRPQTAEPEVPIAQPDLSASQPTEPTFPLFYIDTTPSFPIPTASKPTSTQPVLGAADDEDDEVIVYVAPHPRSGRATAPASKPPTPPPALLPTTSILTGTTETRPLTPPGADTEPEQTEPAHPFANLTFSVLSQTAPRSLNGRKPKPGPRSLRAGRRVGGGKERRKRVSAFGAAALERAEAELSGKDPRQVERRYGSDVEWGDTESDAEPNGEEVVGVEDMLVDEDIDVSAMQGFVKGMSAGGQRWVTMMDVEVEKKIREEEEASDGGAEGSSAESEESEDDEELAKVLEMEEEGMVGEVPESDDEDEDDEEDSDDDDDEDGSPGRNFQARLERLRKQSADRKNTKGKGKARADDDSDDDDFFNPKFTWADGDEDYIATIQDMLDEHSELLEGRDRKEKKKLFKAIHQGDFDGFQPAKRGKKKLADLPLDLQDQWENDRAKKAERKKAREIERLLSAADPLVPKKGGKKGRKATRRAAAAEPGSLLHQVFDIASLHDEIRRFLEDVGGPSSMALPPLAKNDRKVVHELASGFGLKSQSKGKGNDRYTTLIKTTRSGVQINEKKIRRVLRQEEVYIRGSGGRAMPIRMPKHKEGDEVGKAAPKIGESNLGFKMLAAMGWSEGDRIGTSDGSGLTAPLTAIIKTTKLGLGAAR